MKRILALSLSAALLLSACGGTKLDESIISKEVLKAQPDLAGPAATWQRIVNAHAAGDCDAATAELYKDLRNTEPCEALFEYMDDEVPQIEWARTDWNANAIKAKVYELDAGSLGSFRIENGEWKLESAIWEN